MKLENNNISEKKLNELIFLIQNRLNKRAYYIVYSYLNHWMNNIVWRNKQKFPYIPLDLNDMKYYKKISFFKSVMQFDGSRQIPFPQFAIQQLNWFLLTKMRMYSSQKFRFLNFSQTSDDNSLLKKKYHKYNTSEIRDLPDWTYCTNSFSSFEKIIFELRIQEYKNREIAKDLNITAKKVDNAWQRIKKKLKMCIIVSKSSVKC